LFLWLSRDVRKVFQVLESPCMGCGEFALINGEIHHWRTMELGGNGDWEGMMKMGVMGSLTMTWGTSIYSSSRRDAL
jgi:hypothetical protein